MAAGVGQAVHQSGANRIASRKRNNRESRPLLRGQGRGIAKANNHIDMASHHLVDELGQAVKVKIGPPAEHGEIFIQLVAVLREPSDECSAIWAIVGDRPPVLSDPTRYFLGWS